MDSANVYKWLMRIFLTGSFGLFLTSCAVLDTPDGFDDYIGPAGQTDKSAYTATGPKTGEAPAVTPRTKPEGPIDVTVEDAILLALDNNRSLKVERLKPLIRRTFEAQERALFDPLLTGEGAYSRQKGQESRGNFPAIPGITSSRTDLGLGASQFFPTGTDVSLDLSAARTESDRISGQYSSRAGLSVTQSLLRGMGLNVNLANLRQARLDTRVSQYELRGFAEALVARVEETYWDYALAQRQIQIFEESMKLAQQQLRETEEIIKVGRMAETEIAAAEAEIALRRQNLINARSTMATTRLRLLRLLNPPDSNFWKRDIFLLDQPTVPEVELDVVNSHVKVALRMRPDLNQARLGVQLGNLEIVRTKNGLLPKMDLFITLGKTGFADSFGSSVSDITGDNYDFLTGIRFEYPLRNRNPRARHDRALVSRDQAVEAVGNLAQLVDLDVRTAYIEVNRSTEQINASRATRQLQEEKLRVETEKFRVGRSTNFLVAQAQRDLVVSQLSEIRAVVNYLKALVGLHRLEGSLLERRGIMAPGREPVGLSGEKL